MAQFGLSCVNQWAKNISFVPPLSNISIGFWFQWLHNGNYADARNFYTMPESNTPNYMLYVTADGKLYDYGAFDYGTAPRTWVQNQWYFISYCRNATNGNEYYGIDGTVNTVAGGASGDQTSTGSGFTLGTGYVGYIEGVFDEFIITNTLDYTSNFTPPTTELSSGLGLYHFNEGTGTNAVDSGSNGYNLTLDGTNTPTWVNGYPFETSSNTGFSGAIGILT